MLVSQVGCGVEAEVVGVTRGCRMSRWWVCGSRAAGLFGGGGGRGRSGVRLGLGVTIDGRGCIGNGCGDRWAGLYWERG